MPQYRFSRTTMLLVLGVGIFALAPAPKPAIHPDCIEHEGVVGVDDEVITQVPGGFRRAPGVGQPGFQRSFTGAVK